jgi:hypothetical protein
LVQPPANRAHPDQEEHAVDSVAAFDNRPERFADNAQDTREDTQVGDGPGEYAPQHDQRDDQHSEGGEHADDGGRAIEGDQALSGTHKGGALASVDGRRVLVAQVDQRRRSGTRRRHGQGERPGGAPNRCTHRGVALVDVLEGRVERQIDDRREDAGHQPQLLMDDVHGPMLGDVLERRGPTSGRRRRRHDGQCDGSNQQHHKERR